MDIQQALEIALTITPEQLQALHQIALPSTLMILVILTVIELLIEITDRIRQKKTKPSE